MDLLFALALVLMVAFMLVKVFSGSWCRTWAGSGQHSGGRKFPGGPTADPVTGSARESPPTPSSW